MPQLPTSVPIGNDNGSFIWPYFSTNSVQVLREEEAYPPLSLVADIGGVLGLFIGFNFMMLWDWIVWGLTNVHQKTSRKKNVHSKDCRNRRK